MIKSKLLFWKEIVGTVTLLVIILGVCSCKHQSRSTSNNWSINPIMRFVIINPNDTNKLSKEYKNDLKSLKNSLYTVGIKFSEISVEDIVSKNLSNYDIIILPIAAATELGLNEIDKIRASVIEGCNLVFDGVSPLDTAFEIKISDKKISATQVKHLNFPKIVLYWSDSSLINYVDTIRNQYNALYIDKQTKLPIGIWGHYGKGKFIYFTCFFDQVTTQGYSKFPFLIENMNTLFGPVTLAERNNVELFFDPGMRDGSTNIEDLAKLWRNRGVKRIYAAGWYFDFGYDYESLVEACHANGILVYCWLEPPMISKGFWDKHPEWREKTAFLKDAMIDWRSLVNLADAECRKAVFDAIGHLLMTYNWDGVNLAELYFEPSPVGPENPKNFTPMNDIVRYEFKNSSGFDPVLLFDTQSPHYWKKNKSDWKKFATYRKALCFRLKNYFLDFLSTIETKKDNFEVMLTVIDVSMTPDLSDNIAEDTKNTLTLYNKFGFTMQIEDPSSCWGSTPDRYQKLGILYRKSIKEKDKLIFDCNVVSSHEVGYGGFPAEKPTGEEIRQIVYNMALSNSRPAFYAEDALNENDYKNISSTLARGALVSEVSDVKWDITTPFMIRINSGGKNVNFLLDGDPWNAFDEGSIIVPKGKHRLKFDTLKCEPLQYHLKTISGELTSANFSNDQFNFTYIENINYCYAIIDKQPVKIEIDGKISEVETLKNGNEYSLKLPKGKHKVAVIF